MLRFYWVSFNRKMYLVKSTQPRVELVETFWFGIPVNVRPLSQTLILFASLYTLNVTDFSGRMSVLEDVLLIEARELGNWLLILQY